MIFPVFAAEEEESDPEFRLDSQAMEEAESEDEYVEGEYVLADSDEESEEDEDNGYGVQQFFLHLSGSKLSFTVSAHGLLVFALLLGDAQPKKCGPLLSCRLCTAAFAASQANTALTQPAFLPHHSTSISLAAAADTCTENHVSLSPLPTPAVSSGRQNRLSNLSKRLQQYGPVPIDPPHMTNDLSQEMLRATAAEPSKHPTCPVRLQWPQPAKNSGTVPLKCCT